MNPFDSLKAISTRTKKIKLALPDDVLDSVPQWSPSQQQISDITKRGHPFHGYKLEVRDGAETAEFEIRRLTDEQQEQVEKITEAIVPPVKIEIRPGTRGEPPVNQNMGYDEDDPDYKARLATAIDEQRTLIVLLGVVGLYDGTIGEDAKEKIATLRKTLDKRMILYIANEITSWGYSAGNPADFFTSATSSSSTPS